ncbi:phage tail tape measure protein [Escherichia coli]|uniref:phage tail tape measure protein n=1 Tax=Escherichia coli TaxID=562 RepID=UPI000CFCDFC1|nr:phage tail tape measure protein [Escherichia coli]
MAGNFKVGMTLTARDDASLTLVKGLKLTQKAAEDVAKATHKAGQEQKKTDKETVSGTKKALSEVQRATRARLALGIRSEREIRRDIALTIASYNRLHRAGFASAQEQERAMEAAREKARALKRELDGVSKVQEKIARTPVIPDTTRYSRMASRAGDAVTVGAGITAGVAVMAQPVRQQMSYERRLSEMANTAFSDDGLEGRRLGREKLKNSIRNAIMYGGGTKEDAAEAMNEMLASGAFSWESANKLLPQVMKYATASGASPVDLVKMAAKGKQTFRMTDDDIPVMFNMAIAAGKAGSFELINMSRWLSSQMGAASAAGMTGKDDFTRILALNEAAAITAGSSDEAGNNVVNLLAKLSSKDIASTTANIKYKGKWIDYQKTMLEARNHGLNPVEALSGLIDKIVEDNKDYQALQKKLASAKDKGEQAAIYESMARMLEGFGVGTVVTDRQALMALLAYRNNPEYRKKVEETINQQRTLPDGQRVGDVDFDFISGTNDFKTEQAKNVIELSQMAGVKKLSDAAGTVADLISWSGKAFPDLTTAVVTATTAIKAMTTAALVFAGTKILTGGGKTGKGVPDKLTEEIIDVAENTLSRTKVIPKIAGGLLSFGGTVTGLATATSPEEDAAVEGSEERWKAIRAKYPQWLIDAARKKYQPWYQFGEGYSTENEVWIRQYLDELKKTGVIAGDALPTPEQVRQAAGMKNQETSLVPPPGLTRPEYLTQNTVPSTPVNVTTQLVVDGQVLAEAVNKYNLQDGNRGTGGTY